MENKPILEPNEHEKAIEETITRILYQMTKPDPPTNIRCQLTTSIDVALAWHPPINEGYNSLYGLTDLPMLDYALTYVVQCKMPNCADYNTVYRGTQCCYPFTLCRRKTTYLFRVQTENYMQESNWTYFEYGPIAGPESDLLKRLHELIKRNHTLRAENIIVASPELVNVYWCGQTALSLACSRGRSNLIAFLLIHEANVNSQALTSRETCLMQACMNGYVECAKMMLNFGASWDLENNTGLTALHLAVLRGHLNVVKLLLSFGVPVDIVGRNDPFGQTPLLHCIRSINRVTTCSMVRLLIDHNANVNQVDANGNTPLLLAIQARIRGHLQASFFIVCELLIAKADPTQGNHITGECPLGLANLYERENVVSLLRRYIEGWSSVENGGLEEQRINGNEDCI